MATNSKPRKPPKAPPRKPPQQEYEETPDWGSAFHRPENEPPRPGYTGTGVMSAETLEAITNAGGEFQVSVWPRRTKSGLRQLRIHIEAPWEGSEDDDQEQDDQEPADDDIPF